MAIDSSVFREAAKGALGGLIATVPMTAAMLIIQRLLPHHEQTRLEPRKVSDEILRQTSLDSEVEQEHHKVVALGAHFAYGTGAGMLYPAVERYMPVVEIGRGPLFGLGIWAASYAGWLPVADILPPVRDRPLSRNLLLIASHIVWGATLQGVVRSMRDTGTRRGVRMPSDKGSRVESRRPTETWNQAVSYVEF